MTRESSGTSGREAVVKDRESIAKSASFAREGRTSEPRRCSGILKSRCATIGGAKPSAAEVTREWPKARTFEVYRFAPADVPVSSCDLPIVVVARSRDGNSSRNRLQGRSPSPGVIGKPGQIVHSTCVPTPSSGIDGRVSFANRRPASDVKSSAVEGR